MSVLTSSSRRRSIVRLLSIKSNEPKEGDQANSKLRDERIQLLTNKLRASGIDNAVELFQLSPTDLMIRCDMSYDDVVTLLRAVSANIAISKQLGTRRSFNRTKQTDSLQSDYLCMSY